MTTEYEALRRELHAEIAELLDVHRGWCNYCTGREFICHTRPECAARKVQFALIRTDAERKALEG